MRHIFEAHLYNFVNETFLEYTHIFQKITEKLANYNLETSYYYIFLPGIISLCTHYFCNVFVSWELIK